MSPAAVAPAPSSPPPDAPVAPRETRSRRWAQLVVSARYGIVVLALLVSALSLTPALDLLRLHVRTNFFALLPDDHPSVVNLNRIIDKMGGFGDLMVLVQSPDPEANRRYVQELHGAVGRLPWVNYADHGVDSEFFERNALLYVSLEDLRVIEERLRERYEYEVSRIDPMFIDLLDEGPPPIDLSDIEERYRQERLFRPLHASEDGTTAVLAVYPRGISGEIRQSRLYLAEISELTASLQPRTFHPEMSVRIGGSFKSRVEEYDLIMGDLAFSGALMAAVFLVLLLLYFRQIAPVPIVFLTFGLPLIWTFALTRVVISELNFVTVFLVVILAGLGVDFAVHALSRYLEQRAGGASTVDALATVTATTARASWASALTTMAAFFTLLLSRFLGFEQFGLIAGCGVGLAYASSLVLLPALVAVCEDLRLLRPRTAWTFPPPFRLRAARPVLACAVVATSIGLWGMTHVEFETDFQNLQSRLPAPSRAIRDQVRDIFAGRLDPVVVLAEDLDETRRIEEALALHMEADSATPTISAVVSLRDVVPVQQQDKLAAIGDIRALLDRMAEFVDGEEAERIDDYRRMMPRQPVDLADLPDSIRRRFLGSDASDGNLVFVLHDVRLSDTTRAAELVADTRTITADGQSWHGASEAAVINDLLRVMKEDSAVAIPLAMLGAFLVLALDMRSARRAAIPLLPLLLGLCWLAAVMWITGFRLNLYNMVMLPAMVGIGVDSGIHLYHRFLEELPAEGVTGADENLRLDSTNGAVAMSAITTMVAFGSMSLSAHGGLASLGWLALLGLGSVLLAATTVFSLVLLYRPGWFI